MKRFEDKVIASSMSYLLGSEDAFDSSRLEGSCDDPFHLSPFHPEYMQSTQNNNSGNSTALDEFCDTHYIPAKESNENELLVPSTFNESLILNKLDFLHSDEININGSRTTSGSCDINEFLESVEVQKFVRLGNENNQYAAKINSNTLEGLELSGLLPEGWRAVMKDNVVRFTADPRPEIRWLVKKCNGISKDLANCLHVAICKAFDVNGCKLQTSHSLADLVNHLKTCRSKICQFTNCVQYRKIMEHFCCCQINRCYVCRTIFISIETMCDATNFDHDRMKIPRCLPENPDCVFHVFFNSFLRFSSTVLPTLEASPVVGGRWEKIPAFFTDGITQLSSNLVQVESITEPSSHVTSTTQQLEAANDEVTEVKDVKEKEVQSISSLNSTSENSQVMIDTYGKLLRSMYNSQEGVFFMIPVDPVKLGVPDYPEIIREPMDLGTAIKKLNSGQYSSHWDVIYDVNLIFDNAFIYNKKITRVHKHAVKLSQKFNAFTSSLMKSLGYCCNKRYVYTPQPLYCNSSDFCNIPVNTYYYKYDERIFYCVKCFESFGDYVDCIVDGIGSKRIKKDLFLKTRNNETIYEPFVSCEVCKKKFHKVCVGHVDTIDGAFFYCDRCFEEFKIERPVNAFVSKNLPECSLSNYIESRVNEFLLKECKNYLYVSIRMICNIQKILMTKQGLCARFGSKFPSRFPFRSKALFAFQEVEGGREVCFFSMHVQEYGEDCPHPNSRRVYLSYLDSVHYLQPKNYKTRVYHEILLSYLGFCKERGFEYCHIWSCPPCEGDDYVFHCHSYEQKLPKPRRLLDWYNKMIELGIQKKVIIECQDIYKYFENYVGEMAHSIPYFEGDYWSNSLEDLIIEHEKESLNSSNHQSNSLESSSISNKSGKAKNVKNKANNISKKTGPVYLSLNQKLHSLMDKYKEVFFVLKLNEPGKPFIEDNNPILQSELMEGRSGFLSLCRENHWEFSSFRHAVYSTRAMMYVVHQQMYSFVEYSCDKCNAILVNGYHCHTCPSDFDLCSICNVRFEHQHPLVAKIFVDFDSKTLVPKHDTTPKTVGLDHNEQNQSPETARLERFCRSLVHSSTCTTMDCPVESCGVFKNVINHYKRCDVNNRTDCEICYQLFKVLCAHCKRCNSIQCDVPSCSRIKSVFRRNSHENSKKTMSRINKMNSQLMNKTKEEEPYHTLRERKTRQPVPFEEESPPKKATSSITDDPLFEIPHSTMNSDYVFGSLRAGSQRQTNPSIPKVVSDPRETVVPQTQSRRGRKTSKVLPHKEICPVNEVPSTNNMVSSPNKIDTSGATHAPTNEAPNGPNMIISPMVPQVASMTTSMVPPDQNFRQTNMFHAMSANTFITPDGSMIRLPSNHSIFQPSQNPNSQNPSMGYGTVINRNGSATPYVLRNLNGMVDHRTQNPVMVPMHNNMPTNGEFIRIIPNMNIPRQQNTNQMFAASELFPSRVAVHHSNIVEPDGRYSRMFNPTHTFSGSEVMAPRINVQPVSVNNTMFQTQANMQTVSHFGSGHEVVYGNMSIPNATPTNRVNNQNMVFRHMLVNPENGMVNANYHIYPNSSVVLHPSNTPINAQNINNLTLAHMNLLTNQQAGMLMQNTGTRPSGVIINGLDKHVIGTAPVGSAPARNNVNPNNNFVTNHPHNNMNPNVIMRPIPQPFMGSNYSVSGQQIFNQNMNPRHLLNNFTIQDPNAPRS
ncbi:CREB-binding protein [Thelohanellus kitauei]|uniref:histone acetyltransferase n=1 Tax=Thelohanellus kitauei TaxID=669202 RepID=A0A0C2JIN7_THEKT|nr:CREB-binding protein [Thelohanellus kitauei]